MRGIVSAYLLEEPRESAAAKRLVRCRGTDRPDSDASRELGLFPEKRTQPPSRIGVKHRPINDGRARWVLMGPKQIAMFTLREGVPFPIRHVLTRRS